MFDLLSNSLNSFFKEIYRDQFGEFVCGYWGLKVNLISNQIYHQIDGVLLASSNLVNAGWLWQLSRGMGSIRNSEAF